MRKSLSASLAAAALSGLFAGATQAASPSGDAPVIKASSSLKGETLPGRTLAAGATSQPSAVHDCKGKNDCKGTGGCKSSDNGCKGKNSCKGKGGCNTATGAPTKVA
jgi:hypothetical protein